MPDKKTKILIVSAIAIVLIAGFFLHFFYKPGVKPISNSTTSQLQESGKSSSTTSGAQNDYEYWKKELIWIYYVPSTDKMPYGNYLFKYSAELVLEKDAVATDSSGKKRHFVILERRTSSGTDSSQSVEINSPVTSCEQYKKCVKVSGIAIGATSDNPEFLNLFNLVVDNFQVMNAATTTQNIKTTTTQNR